MARPKKLLFFEQPIPECYVGIKWLPSYHYNCQKVVDYLVLNGVKDTIYYETVRCFEKLRNYLISNDAVYSVERADLWFDSTAPHPKGSQTALYRLEDIYRYGEVQPENAFPICFPNYNNLNKEWKTLLDDYLLTINYSTAYIKEIRNEIARFLYRIQENGIRQPSDITYDILQDYIEKAGHRSVGCGARYIYSIGDILLFISSLGLCSPGIGWYPYYRMHDRVTSADNLTKKQKELIEACNRSEKGRSMSLYNNAVTDFLKDFSSFGYRKTSNTVVRFTLYNLMLFLDMNGLNYHHDIALVWLKLQMPFFSSTGWKGIRRILNLFEQFIERGAVLPQKLFYEKKLLSEVLPEWCKCVLKAFLYQKDKEGWEDSTICMYRSSVTRFCQFLVDSEITSFSNVTPEMIKAFNKQDQHLTVEGKNAYNVRIRKFIQFLERKEALPYGIHHALLCTAAPREKAVVTLTEEEKSEIAERNVYAKTQTELRSRAILLIGMKIGLRASDIVSIKLGAIDWNQQTIRVLQKKTRHEVLLPMPTEVGNAIYLYIKNGRPETSSDILFVRTKIPYDAAKRGICLYSLKAALPKRKVSLSGFHVTRRTFATDRLRAATSKATIADMLGHKDTNSLSPYLNFDSERMAKCPLSLSHTGLEMKGERYD